jgi:hypothetical protein
MKFSITVRDIFWLMLVLALCLRWSLDHWKSTSTRYHITENGSGLRILDNIGCGEWKIEKGVLVEAVPPSEKKLQMLELESLRYKNAKLNEENEKLRASIQTH